MKITLLFIGVLFLSLTACHHQQKQESPNPYLPKIVEAKGYVVPKDSMAEPKVAVAGKPVRVKAGKPEVILTNTNVVPAGAPKVLTAGIPKIFKPGEDSIFVQKTVQAIDSPFIAGIPEMVLVKDAYIKDNNPKNFSSFTKLQGLGHKNIFSIMQDSSGNLWFATAGGGACRYDGKYFTHFTTKEGLSNDFVTSILQDKQGNMWFGTWRGGANRFDGKMFTHFGVKEGLSYDVVLAMLQDKSGNIWFGEYGGHISKYDGKSFTNFIIQDEKTGNSVMSIIQDKGGNLWFATLSNGVFCYDGRSISHFTQKEGLSTNSVQSMLEDKNGKIWFGLSKGACCYDGKSFLQYTEKEGLSNKTVYNMIQDKSGDLWFGTNGDGAIRYNGKSFEHFTEKEGLGNNAVYRIFQDKNGTIWFGGIGSGVSRYNGNIFTHYTDTEGLSDKRVLSIMQDKDGNLWFGTWAGGVNRYNGKSFTRFTEKEGLSNQMINCILQDKRGNIWFGTWGAGAICYDGKSFLHYTEKEGLAFNYVQSMLLDKSGNIWFGTDSKGECRYDGKYFTTYADKEGLSNSNIHSSLLDKNGNLWFGTPLGVNRYDGKSFTHFTEKEGLSNNYITGMLQDNNGNFWFGTRGGGVCRYDGKSFMYYTEEEGLCSNDVESVVQDKSGNLWFGTSAGLSKLSADYMVKLVKAADKGSIDQPVLFKNYTYEDGFLGIGCEGTSICQDNKGIIWIGTNDRLTTCHPKGDEAYTSAPNIQVTGIQLYNENISWLKFDKKKDTSLVLGNGVRISKVKFDSISKWYFLPQNLSLAYNNNYLTFHFIGITQKQSQKVKYRYKLEGLDENWSGITSRNEVPYGNIPHGTYTFKVKSMNSEGCWSKEFSYTFTIRPPWWKTWWTYIVYVLLIIAGIWAVIYSIIQYQREKIRLLEKERSRISRELHDDIGSELNRITMISQLLHKKITQDDEIQEKLVTISDTGKKVLGSIGEIIWTMNPQKDNLESLVAYIRRFATEYLDMNNIEVSIEFPDDIPVKSVSDKFRRNIFLVVKEAINNITKYSKASKVRLSLELNKKSADLEISDNGAGFSVKEKHNWGNGLRNMDQRMKDIGGSFLISSVHGQGTMIRLSFPVR